MFNTIKQTYKKISLLALLGSMIISMGSFAMERPTTSNMLARSYNRVHSLVANHKVAATVLSAATLGAAYYAYKNWPHQKNFLSALDENKEKFYPKDFESLFAKLGIRYLDHLEFENNQHSAHEIAYQAQLPSQKIEDTMEYCLILTIKRLFVCSL